MSIEISSFKDTLPIQAEIDTDILRELVTQLDFEYWMIGTYPAQEELERKFKLTPSDLKRLEVPLNSILKGKRDLPEIKFKSLEYKVAEKEALKADLDPLFVVAVNLLCDTMDKRSRSVKLKAVGLSTKAWNVLLENPKNLEFYRIRVKKAFGHADESAKLSLIKNVEAGDLQSIKYYYEFSGIFDPNKEITTNLNKLINLFMEILVRHVPVETVQKISEEFEMKMLEA